MLGPVGLWVAGGWAPSIACPVSSIKWRSVCVCVCLCVCVQSCVIDVAAFHEQSVSW